MSMLPSGWMWADPRDTAYPWRAETRAGAREGLALSIEGAQRERVIKTAQRIDFGLELQTVSTSLPQGQGWVPRGGFIP